MTTQTEAPPPPTATFDEARAEAFVGQALTDVSGFFNVLLAGIGDRLGLWRALAEHGPLTSEELAERADVDERYAREWLGGMTTSKYVEFSPEAGTWALPSEHAPVLAQEGWSVFFGGTFQMLHGTSSVYDEVLEVFRTGGGVRQEAYHRDMWDGLERFTAGWFENHLIQEWMPDLPEAGFRPCGGCRWRTRSTSPTRSGPDQAAPRGLPLSTRLGGIPGRLDWAMLDPAEGNRSRIGAVREEAFSE